MIHYFTGTGNSYFIASQLATSLNLSLHALKEGPVEDRDPVVGIVFPVYFGDAPDFVTDALEGLTFPGTPYLFAVATSGTSFGAAFQSIDNALQKRGNTLPSLPILPWWQIVRLPCASILPMLMKNS